MSVFTDAISGSGYRRSFFPVKERFTGDIPIGRVIPEYADIVVPHDIWHLKQIIFARTQPMLAPLLTDLDLRVRGWFVPLRQIEEKTELILTGSDNGKFKKDLTIPTFKGMFDDVPADGTTAYDVDKYSVLDYMLGMPVGNYKKIKDDKSLPAQYWLKGFAKVWFDWYRDENLSEFDDFDDFWDTIKVAPGKWKPFYANWRKDYLMSALPFQQKGIRPTFDFNLVNPDDFTTFFGLSGMDIVTARRLQGNVAGNGGTVTIPITGDFTFTNATSGQKNFDVVKGTKISEIDQPNLSESYNVNFEYENPGIDFAGLASTLGVDDLRVVTQTQRIMERLARCGSRYTEYLRATFGCAPADETLQRVKYLGGYKQPIAVSQVEQTAEDGENPVGTLRGKGVSLSNSRFDTQYFKEWGMLYITVEVMPKAQYTQGILRKYTYKERFDFPNPAYCGLSEQEIRNGEIFIEFNPAEGEEHINDETFGFTEIYNELRSGRDKVVGDMRDTQAYWTMARYFSDTPVLSEELIQARDEEAFAVPFAVTDKPPIILELNNKNGVYRSLTKYGVPGLVDHY